MALVEARPGRGRGGRGRGGRRHPCGPSSRGFDQLVRYIELILAELLNNCKTQNMYIILAVILNGRISQIIIHVDFKT